jgi:hypothetical protein
MKIEVYALIVTVAFIAQTLLSMLRPKKGMKKND